MSRDERQALTKALEAFEAIASTPGDEAATIQACMTWEILLRQHENEIPASTLRRYKARAKLALDKVLGN